jgi:predicted acetyltransferase
MEFRLTGPRDEGVQWLWDYCFEKKGDPFFEWYFSRYCQEGNVLAGYADGRLEACLHLNPVEVFLRGKTLPASYIVGLGVAPEARGGGAGALLRGALAEMRRRQHWISIIMPARAGIYYPYQWELCYHQLGYSLPVEELAGVGAKWGSFRLLRGPQDIGDLADVYRRFVADRHGYTLRSDAYWRQIVEEQQAAGGYIYILENAAKAEGYIFYKLHQGRLLVREMAYTGRQALLSLAWFLYQHRSQVKTAKWNAPADDWLHFLLPDPREEVSLEPFMAARVVDAEQALTAVSYPADIDANLVLDIEDKQAPWNNRLLSLAVSDGRGRVSEPIKRPDDVVRCQIGGLTQLLFGRLSAAELRAMDRLQTEDAAALALLDRLFPKCANYINEYY